jgi:hypothetical protein
VAVELAALEQEEPVLVAELAEPGLVAPEPQGAEAQVCRAREVRVLEWARERLVQGRVSEPEREFPVVRAVRAPVFQVASMAPALGFPAELPDRQA